jgi:hypothetical protein
MKAVLGIGLCLSSIYAAPVLVGDWTFDQSSQPYKASVGSDLIATGTPLSVNGPEATDLALEVGLGQHLKMTVPGGSSQDYAIVMDVRWPQLPTKYSSLFQTDITNQNDAELFLNASGALGRSVLGGYQGSFKASTWYRLVINVKNGSFFQVYRDGALLANYTPQAAGGQYDLASAALLFADNDGEDEAIQVARVRLYGTSLSAPEIAALGGFAPVSSAQLKYGPWLQNVQPNAMTIMWQQTSNQAGRVEYGTDLTLANSSNLGSVVAVGPDFAHKVVIDQLSPSTQYNYRVVMADGTKSAIKTFKTAPSGDADFVFAQWGDTHRAYGDEMYQFVLDQRKSDFAVATGDLTNTGGSYNQDFIDVFLENDIKLGAAKVPLFVAMGNHDVASRWGGGDLIRHYFDQPKAINSDPNGFGGNYVFFYGGCAFIVLDWNQLPDVRDEASARATSKATYTWLEAQLKRSDVQNARFIFSFVHRAPYYERWFSAEDTLQQNVYPALIEKYGVNASFSGHMHGYERGQKGNVAKPSTFYITAGGGSYLDNGEPVRTDGKYAHITQGANETSPTGFNRGLLNEMMTIEVKGDTAIARMHAFLYNNGVYSKSMGVLDSVKMISRRNSVIVPTDLPIQHFASFEPLISNSDKMVWEAPKHEKLTLKIYQATGKILAEVAIPAGQQKSLTARDLGLSAGPYLFVAETPTRKKMELLPLLQ